MKCPKCGYLGFAQAERCRNCGYDFALAPVTPPPPPSDLTLRPPSRPSSPADDLVLIDAAAPSRPSGAEAGTRETAQDPAGDLPLFTPSPAYDPVAPPRLTPPRPPLAVRRPTPDAVRLASDARLAVPRETTPDPELDMRLQAPVSPAVRATETAWAPVGAAGGETATLETRAIAMLIDLGLLAIVDLLVIYFTLQVVGLTASEVGRLPPVPLLAYLVVQNGGYLVAFTAGGQTIGKMLTGIRVVPAAPNTRLDLPRALVRTAVWSVLLLPAGLGLITAIFNDDRRGLHDRVAGTKVVRVTR